MFQFKTPQIKSALIAGALLVVLPLFQNCAPVSFNAEELPSESAKDDNPGGNGGVDRAGDPEIETPDDDHPIDPIETPTPRETYTNLGDTRFSVIEDQPLTKQPDTWSKVNGTESEFALISQPKQGKLVSFNASTGAFVYQPNLDFFGLDEFQYSEKSKVTDQLETRKVVLDVTPDNDSPWIVTDSLSFETNSSDNPMVIEARDKDSSTVTLGLSADNKSTELKSAQGTLKKTAPGTLTYKPNLNFRGTDDVEIFAFDGGGASGRKTIRISIGNPFHEIRPAIAVRAGACLACHANVKSDYITDFGFGGTSFFGGKNISSPWGHVLTHSQRNDTVTTAWETMSFADSSRVFVPKATLPSTVKANVESAFPWYSRKSATEWTTTNLKEHISLLEARKTKGRAKEVREVKSLYIGAPTVSELRTVGTLSTTKKSSYWKNAPTSASLSGLVDKTNYFTNADSGLTCDGDLFIDRPILLKNLKLKTVDGCRIHSTSAIFVQGSIEYVAATAPGTMSATTVSSNLQLVSSRLVSFGVGPAHCETKQTPSGQNWYFRSSAKNPDITPIDKRFINAGFASRNVTAPASGVDRTSTNQSEEGKALAAIAKSIPGLEDASCHSRTQHFEKVMVVAPIVHSRYIGNFKGVVNAEFALFSLGKFAFEFDDVFTRVPVLPLLKPEMHFSITEQ